MYYLSVLCNSLKERLFCSASVSKADAKVLPFSELQKLFMDIFEKISQNKRKGLGMRHEKYVVEHKNNKKRGKGGREGGSTTPYYIYTRTRKEKTANRFRNFSRTENKVFSGSVTSGNAETQYPHRYNIADTGVFHG